MLKAIFFDAVGTLFHLTKTVGDHYAFVADEVGLKLDAKKLDAAFYSAWKQMSPREAIDGPRENDVRGLGHLSGPPDRLGERRIRPQRRLPRIGPFGYRIVETPCGIDCAAQRRLELHS